MNRARRARIVATLGPASRAPATVKALAQAGVDVFRLNFSHGSPWDYDRRVPIIFWWPGAHGQERFLPMRTIDIAPTLAHLIGVKPTDEVDGRCMDLPGFAAGRCEAQKP